MWDAPAERQQADAKQAEPGGAGRVQRSACDERAPQDEHEDEHQDEHQDGHQDGHQDEHQDEH